MSQAIIVNTKPVVNLINNQALTTSINIADFFNKQHKEVLRKIENLKPELPIDFWERNFTLSKYQSKTGKNTITENPMYLLTKKAFTFLAMGFTGTKANQFKLAYIDAFEAMEETIKKQQQKQLPQTSALSTAKDRQPIFTLVRQWAKQKGLFHKDCWKAIHKEFALHSISELPKDKIQDVCNFIAAQMGESLAPAVCEKSLPAPKPELTFLPVTPKQPNVWIDYELAVYEKFHAEKLINQYHFKDYAYNARLLSWKANALFNEYEAKIKDLMKDYDMLAKPVYKAMLSKVMDQPYDSLDNTAYETDAERNRHNDCAEFTSQMWGTLNRVRNELTYRRDTLRNEVQDSIRTLVSIAKLLDM